MNTAWMLELGSDERCRQGGTDPINYPVKPESNNPPAAATQSEPARHAHYRKDVSKLASVDVYRVLDLFGVTHPCAQHAAKKVLCAGIRGAKDIDKDIQEAIDTLVRWQAMRKEDAK